MMNWDRNIELTFPLPVTRNFEESEDELREAVADSMRNLFLVEDPSSDETPQESSVKPADHQVQPQAENCHQVWLNRRNLLMAPEASFSVQKTETAEKLRPSESESSSHLSVFKLLFELLKMICFFQQTAVCSTSDGGQVHLNLTWPAPISFTCSLIYIQMKENLIIM